MHFIFVRQRWLHPPATKINKHYQYANSRSQGGFLFLACRKPVRHIP